jgi:hypothetical protein
VQVVGTAPTANPYGAKPVPGAPVPPPVWKRIEHCEFLEPTKTYNCRKLAAGESEKACIDDCNRSTMANCNGVNVVSVHNPDSVYEGFRDMVNVPFGTGCQRSTLEVSPPNPRVRTCYTLITRADSDLPDEQEYRVTDDPDEPTFYSTCWKRVPPVTFDTPPEAEPYRPPRFLFGHKCISCDEAFANMDESKPQFWNVRSAPCANCDLLAPPPPPPAFEGTGVLKVSIYNADSEQEWKVIAPGDSYPVPSFDIAVVVDPEGTPGQVRIQIDGPEQVDRTEKSRPYASHGDATSGGKLTFEGFAPKPGTYKLTITVDSKKSASLSFTLAQS